MNLTEDQKETLRIVVRAHLESDGESFYLITTLGGCFLVSGNRKLPLPPKVDRTDFRHLADEGLLTVLPTKNGGLTGKPTAQGLEAPQRSFDDQQPYIAQADSGKDRVFRRVGQIWTLTFEGNTVLISDRKGLTYICELLRRQGRPIHVTQLATTGVSADARSLRLSSGDELLDDTAILQYRDSITDLEAGISEAERNNDLSRKEALESEKEEIASALRSALGRGGKHRRANDDVERFRKAVSNAINLAIKAIRQVHRPLADHLQRSIDRGKQLSYTGDGIPWSF